MPNVTTTYSQKELEEILRRHLGLSQAARVLFSYDGGDGPRGGSSVSASVITAEPTPRPTGGGSWSEKS